jgi:hypothetical protein
VAITRFTRQELLDLLWTKPLRTLAPEIGVSDPALKKAAVRAGLPIPPLGHWIKLAHGKKSAIKPTLPPRGFGSPQEIEFGFEEWPYPPKKLPPAPEPPDAPVFDETVESVRERAVKAVGKIVVARDLKMPHPFVRTLLADDVAMAEKARMAPSYMVSSYPVRYVSPIDHRKLRLLSALALGLARAEVKLSLWRAERATIQVGDNHSFPVSVTGKTEKGRKPVDASNKLSIIAGMAPRGDGRVIARWEDDQDRRLESFITEIVVEIAVLAEAQYRKGRLAHHQWQVEWWLAEVEQARKAKLEAERQERERIEKLERDRIRRLLRDATRLGQADAIRAYVAEAGRRSAGDVDVDAEAFDRWRRWALEQADRIDPVASGAFLKAIDDVG